MLLVAAGGEVERVLGVRHLAGGAVLDRVEARPARRVGEALGEQPRRAGVLLARARPEHALLSRRFVVGDAAVVGRAAGGGAAELVEHALGVCERELLAVAEALGEFAQDVDVAPHAARRRAARAGAGSRGLRGWSSCPLPRPTARPAGRRARPRRSRSRTRRTRPAGRAPRSLRSMLRGVRRGDRDVRAEHEQRADAALGPERVEQLVRALALAGQARRRRRPRPSRRARGARDSRSAGSPGSWSAFWPCSRPPWPLPWPGEAAVAAGGLADLAEREHQVDEREDGVDALALLLGAAAR